MTDEAEKLARASLHQREELMERCERMEKALRDIESWAHAYPVNVFPKPDLRRAAEILSINNMSLDAISADAMRHVLEGVINLVKDGLGNE